MIFSKGMNNILRKTPNTIHGISNKEGIEFAAAFYSEEMDDVFALGVSKGDKTSVVFWEYLKEQCVVGCLNAMESAGLKNKGGVLWVLNI